MAICGRPCRPRESGDPIKRRPGDGARSRKQQQRWLLDAFTRAKGRLAGMTSEGPWMEKAGENRLRIPIGENRVGTRLREILEFRTLRALSPPAALRG